MRKLRYLAHRKRCASITKIDGIKMLREKLPFIVTTIRSPILYKNPTNELIYVNNILITLLHSYTFQPSTCHPQGTVKRFVSRVNKMRSQM